MAGLSTMASLPTPTSTNIIIPLKRTAEDHHEHAPAVPSPLKSDRTGTKGPRSAKEKIPMTREPREKKETFKKREAKGAASGTQDLVRATPDRPTAAQQASKKGHGQEGQPAGVLAPIRYKLPPPKLTDFECPRGPVLTAHHVLRTPTGEDVQFYETSEHVYNRKGFRYTHCIADPSFPSSWYYRPSETEPFRARFDFEDTSSHLLFDRAGTYVTTEKGFRMVRANVAAREGRSYWECRIVRGIRPLPSDRDRDPAETGAARPQTQEPRGHVRMGWARREASLDAPVGFDAYSYGLRDVGGQKTHMSRPKDFFPAGEEIREGDVIGLQMDLPSSAVHRSILKGPSQRQRPDQLQQQQQQNRSKTNKGKTRPSDVKEKNRHDETKEDDREEAPDVIRDKVPIRYKAHLYFEQFDYHPTKELEELFNPAPAFSANTTTSSSAAASNTAAAASAQAPSPTHVLPSRRTLPGSSIKIYKNGRYMGTPFTHLLAFLPPASRPLTHGIGHGREGLDDGMLGYFPAVSVFRGGAAQINLGPDFWFPPEDTNDDDHDDDDVVVDMVDDDAINDDSTSSYPRPRLRPVGDRYEEQIAESVVYDIIDEVDFWLQDHGALVEIIIPDMNHPPSSSMSSSFPTSSTNIHGVVSAATVDPTGDRSTSLVGPDQQAEEIKEVIQEDE